MAEQDVMQGTKEAQKTVIAFIAGLLIGGLLVWMFVGSANNATNNADTQPADTTDSNGDTSSVASSDNSIATNAKNTESKTETPTMATGEGSINVSNQPAGNSVTLTSTVFPNDEGWIGVRDYSNDQMGSVLGVARFSKSEGLIPETIALLRATTAGNEYAVVFYTENGDHTFNLASDAQVDTALETFRAQ